MRQKSKPSALLPFLLCLLVSILKSNAQVVGYIPDFHPRYRPVATVPGAILDIRENEILYRNIDDVLATTNLLSHESAIYFTNHIVGIGPAYITPTGIFGFGSPALQIDGQEQIPLGECSMGTPDFSDHIVDGRFGVLHTADGIFLRDFVARTNCLISATADFLDVASNGNVVYTARMNDNNFAVFWFHDGETETLAVASNYPTPFVATDGTNVLWSVPLSALLPPFGSVYLRTPSQTILLSTNSFLASSPPIRFLDPPPFNPAPMKNGRIIFPRQDPIFGGQQDLWQRSPDGTITQISTSSASVLAMRDDGGVLMLGGDDRIESGVYYVSPDGFRKFINAYFPLAKYYAVGKRFYAYGPTQAADGTHVYELEVEQDPFGVVYPSYDPSTQIFSFGLIPGSPGDYEVQRSNDFVEWAQIATVTANADTILTGAGMWIQVTNTPGCFRLRKL